MKTETNLKHKSTLQFYWFHVDPIRNEGNYTFWMTERALEDPQLPFLNDPQVPSGLPKLAKLILENSLPPWQDSLTVLP